jgi:3-hydroxyisobutyrate dehydrogenase
MEQPKLGWAGLGNMGIPMVSNLLKANYSVQVYNRTREKEQELTAQGAVSAVGLKELSEASDIIFVMVSDDAAAKAIFTDADGLLSGEVSGKLFVNVSTVGADTSRFLEAECKKNGTSFIEAPVSGSVKPAQDGTLIILAGGSADNVEQAKPVLSVLGKMIMHVGPVGAGAAAKLAINYLLAVNVHALAETVLFAAENGVSPQDMLTIVNEGAVGNGVSKMKTPAILKEDFPAAFALKHIVKDLNLAKELGLNAPLSNPVLESYKAALSHGLGNEDLMAIYKHLKK